MKKIISVFLLVFIISFSFNVGLAKASTSNSSTIQILELLLTLDVLRPDQVEIIELVLQIMKAAESVEDDKFEENSDDYSDHKEDDSGSYKESDNQNLSINSMDLKYPAGMDFGSTGNVLDQHVKVTVKNNAHGSYNLSGKYVNYEIYLYDVTSGKDKVGKVAAGEFLVPYANGYSEFSAYFEGGEPFDGDNYEKDYSIKVEIDSDDDLEESNEKDNYSWSDEWQITYYKG